VSGLTKDDRLIRVGSTDVEGMMTGADGSAHVAGKRYTTMEETQAERINRQALAEEQERVLGLIGGSDMLGMRAKMGGGVRGAEGSPPRRCGGGGSPPPTDRRSAQGSAEKTSCPRSHGGPQPRDAVPFHMVDQRVSNYQQLGREGSASASLQRGAASALRLVTQLKVQFYHEIRMIKGREREA
jgi:hypothetical protein